jgi:hypothetical protein
MKSLSLSTPLVRTNKSNGGLPEVYMWLVIVSAVIVSAFGYIVMPAESSDFRGGESGCSVVVEEAESSRSSDRDDGGGEDSLIDDSPSLTSPCLDSIFCVMRFCEKGVLWGRIVVE